MRWLGLGVMAAIGVVVLGILRSRPRPDDLGPVSSHWIAEHKRVDAP